MLVYVNNAHTTVARRRRGANGSFGQKGSKFFISVCVFVLKRWRKKRWRLSAAAWRRRSSSPPRLQVFAFSGVPCVSILCYEWVFFGLFWVVLFSFSSALGGREGVEELAD